MIVRNMLLLLQLWRKVFKKILEYLKQTAEIYLPVLGRNLKLKPLTIEEELALEKRSKKYLILKLNEFLNRNLES